ncbi:MAG: hemerythrin domain-containing protein [Pseudomonadota bacterium]
MTSLDSRRLFLTLGGVATALVACRPEVPFEAEPAPRSTLPAAITPAISKDNAGGVGAVEDLMREHGVIRRLLVVYRETASRLRLKSAAVPPSALQRAAALMQTFGEDYHERALEEEHLFPAVRKAGGAAATLIDTLLAQHQRGREITSYVLGVSKQTIGVRNAEPLAHALEGFARMYEEHAAQEDTIVFQAWKDAMSKQQLDEMGELFEDIEHKTFGKDGFDDARGKIAAIEQELGITLASMLAPTPPVIL